MDTLSFEDIRQKVADALRISFDSSAWIRAIYPASVIFETSTGGSGGTPYVEKLWSVSYVLGTDGAVTFADDHTEVEKVVSYEPVTVAGFSLEPGHEDGQFVVRTGKVFEAGNYPDKNFSITPQELDTAVAAFSPVANDLEHRQTILSNELGDLSNVRRDGMSLFGDVRIPKWLDKIVGKDPLKVSVAFDRGTKRIIGNALTINPRIKDAQVVAAFNDSRNGGTMKPNLFQRMAAFFADAAKDPDMVATLEGDSSVTPTEAVKVEAKPSADFAAIQAENVALKAQLVAEADRKVADIAVAFAQKAISDRKAIPAQKDSLVALFTQAVKDDNAGQVAFADDGTVTEGERVKALRAMIEATPAHTFTAEKLATFACGADDAPKPPTVDVKGAFDQLNRVKESN